MRKWLFVILFVSLPSITFAQNPSMQDSIKAWKAQAPRYYSRVNAIFIRDLNRKASDEELLYFGTLLASKKADESHIDAAIKMTSEYHASHENPHLKRINELKDQLIQAQNMYGASVWGFKTQQMILNQIEAEKVEMEAEQVAQR